MSTTWKPVANDGAGHGGRVDAQFTTVDQLRVHMLRDLMLDRCFGAADGKTVTDLTYALNERITDNRDAWPTISERKLRTLISELRHRGWPICGTPETGYFWPATRAEAEATLRFLNTRIRSSVEMRDGVRRGLDNYFGEADEATEQLELEL